MLYHITLYYAHEMIYYTSMRKCAHKRQTPNACLGCLGLLEPGCASRAGLAGLARTATPQNVALKYPPNSFPYQAPSPSELLAIMQKH